MAAQEDDASPVSISSFLDDASVDETVIIDHGNNQVTRRHAARTRDELRSESRDESASYRDGPLRTVSSVSQSPSKIDYAARLESCSDPGYVRPSGETDSLLREDDDVSDSPEEDDGEAPPYAPETQDWLITDSTLTAYAAMRGPRSEGEGFNLLDWMERYTRFRKLSCDGYLGSSR